MTDTIPNVPRELLERVCSASDECRDNPMALFSAADELRALLSAPSPAGVDGLEVALSSEQILEVFERNGFRIELGASFSARGQIAQLLNAVGEIERLSDAQAIIDGLRGEVAELRRRANSHAERMIKMSDKEDQYAQRIGELASHLEFAVTMLTVAGLAGNAQVEAMRSALSAGHEPQ